ncbi:MAG: DUF2330 domain-containing protein [Myxococcota bacterium]
MTLRNAYTLALAGLMAAGLTLQPAPAAACGGFFCDNSQPVNQEAEGIIFAQEPDGTVTAVIQIQYEGPSERFAWMLPVSGSPDISVSSNAAFTRLQAASNPQYTMTRTVEGTCRDGDFAFGGAPTADGLAVDLGVGFEDAGSMENPITVVDEGSVGPYDFVLIAIDPEASDLVGLAIEWLQDNGYDVPDMGSDVLRPYLEAGQNLLAFRLTKGNDAGAIRPVRLSFGEGLPSIPLRPTAIATVPDMGIMVWVLGPSRAIPANYRSLELNEALINWFNPNSNYDDVVSRAANEAQGQGFVTEMSGSAPELGAVVWNEFEQSSWDRLRSEDWTGREGDLVGRSGDFFFLDGMREVLEAHLTPPEGVSADEFFACIGCYVEFSARDIEGFEPADFLADMAENVINPMVETQELFERTAVQTRMYTTMSADEMTMDPVFDFNADLPEVSNRHTAERIIECSPGVFQNDAPWRVELASGDVVRGEGNTWPFDLDTTDMPASARIKRVGTSGEGNVEEDNTADISQSLATHNRTIPGPPVRVAGSGFCSASPAGQSAAGFGILGLALGALLFRRRQV